MISEGLPGPRRSLLSSLAFILADGEKLESFIKRRGVVRSRRIPLDWMVTKVGCRESRVESGAGPGGGAWTGEKGGR